MPPMDAWDASPYVLFMTFAVLALLSGLALGVVTLVEWWRGDR